MEWLNYLGAGGTILMACLGLIFPKVAASLVGLTAHTNAGRSEFRATYGGLFLPLGLIPILTHEPLAFAITGLCWLGAALGRIISIIVDQASDRQNWLAVGVEIVFAALLLAGQPLAALLS